MRIAGIVLAGGLARRMGGGDKGLRLLGGRTLLDWVIERARPQVVALALNANGDPARFAALGLEIVADPIPGFAGPLAGVLAGLDWAAGSDGAVTHVASFASDAPFFPRDLVARLAGAVAEGADLACAASDGQAHPVFGLWPVALRQDLRHALEEEGIRKVDHWTARHRLAQVAFPVAGVDPFFNANRPEDLAAAERLAAAADAAV
jgi:molybdopterin-guanine dinucleotide biosynthesis protein A